LEDERSGRCSSCSKIISKLFESEVRRFLGKKWGIRLREGLVHIYNTEKKFDFVSPRQSIVGDAKFLKEIKMPAAKYSGISEYVWLLQHVKAKRKFLVFE